jgi:hypothetical protein
MWRKPKPPEQDGLIGRLYYLSPNWPEASPRICVARLSSSIGLIICKLMAGMPVMDDGRRGFDKRTRQNTSL